MASVTLNDVELYYEVIGSGQPLMLIAGLASDSQSWLPLVEGLSAQYQLILLDNRGVGRTQPHSAVSTIEQMADDCMALADYLGIQQLSLVGHSMGGMIALSCAARYPQRVHRLVLLATAASNSERNRQLFQHWLDYWRVGLPLSLWFRNVFYWIFSPTLFADAQAIHSAVDYALRYPYPQTLIGFERQVQALAQVDLAANLPLIHHACLLVVAESDLIFPVKESLASLSSLPNHRVVSIAGAGHSLVVERPKLVEQAVLEFLAEA